MFFRLEIAFVVVHSLKKNIQSWQFKQKEVFNPYDLVQAAQLFVSIAAVDIIILITASV